MKLISRLFTCALLCLSFISSGADLSTPEYLQSICVKVIVGDGTGSGIAFTRKDANGKDVTFIWTAAHIFTHHEEDFFSMLFGSQNTNTAPTEYAMIQQDIVKNGVVVGRTNLSAKLFKFSDDDNGQDLAILKVNGPFFNKNTVKFDLSGDIPKLGQPIFSMGCPYGLYGSFSPGVYSYIGRNFEGVLYDESNCRIFPGSSGGGIFNTNGVYVAMSNVMKASSLNFITPMRRIQQWVKAEHIEWTLDSSLPMPMEKEIKKINMWDTTLTKRLEILQ